ncbi:MAG: hypothetical protein EXS64_20110 [Candidatus Latescibacteria bacterium]|nr:hypothetical protein [Candidatus Latescibacterota bacterium]
MPDLNLTLGGSRVLLLLFPLFLALAVYAYRRPDRSAPGAVRTLLLLRSAALLIAVALLVEPLFGLTVRRLRPPTVALLLDDSASMTLADVGIERRKVLLDLLQDPQVHDALNRIGDLKAFAFAESLRAKDLSPAAGEGGMASSLKWDGNATDLGGAFASLQERFKGQDLSAVVLISDGATNVGVDAEKAASALGVPVYSVGVGDPKEPKDIAVVSALCDPVGTVGKDLPVRVTIRSSGYAGLRPPVEVRSFGQLLQTQPIVLEDGEQQIELSVKPETPGLQTWEVRVPSQPGERSAVNNITSFSVEALKGRRRVLFAAGSPVPDFGYLRRLLASDETMEVEVIVAAGQGGLSRQDSALLKGLKDYDLVVLVDLPSSALAGADRSLVAFVRAGGGLLVVGGRNAFDSGYATLGDLLPVRVVEAGPFFEEDRFQVAFAEVDRAILRLSDDPDADAQALSELPPLLGFNRTLGARPGATVLAVHPRLRTSEGARMPLIVTATFGAGKVVAIPCATLYRLDALMWGVGKTGEVAQTLWRNTFRWLLTPENARRVRVATDRPIWRSGEPITLRASVYDPLMRPQRGATVTVSISDSSSGPRAVTLTESEEGRYIGQVRGLSAGDHAFEGRSEVEGAEVGRDAGTFTVSATGLEFDVLRMNEDLLRRIARVSGGGFSRPAEFPAFIAHLKLAPKPILEVHETRLWGNPYALAAFVVLLAAEWTLRRRRGML